MVVIRSSTTVGDLRRTITSVLSGSSALTCWILGPCLITHRLTNRHLTDDHVRLIDLGHLGHLQNGDTLLLSGRILGWGGGEVDQLHPHQEHEVLSGEGLGGGGGEEGQEKDHGGTSSGSHSQQSRLFLIPRVLCCAGSAGGTRRKAHSPPEQPVGDRQGSLHHQGFVTSWGQVQL